MFQNVHIKENRYKQLMDMNICTQSHLGVAITICKLALDFTLD